jgi:hypothetical protein
MVDSIFLENVSAGCVFRGHWYKPYQRCTNSWCTSFSIKKKKTKNKKPAVLASPKFQPRLLEILDWHLILTWFVQSWSDGHLFMFFSLFFLDFQQSHTQFFYIHNFFYKHIYKFFYTKHMTQQKHACHNNYDII